MSLKKTLGFESILAIDPAGVVAHNSCDCDCYDCVECDECDTCEIWPRE